MSALFTGYNGQSLFDVCMNTYGSLDFMYKLLIDSDVANIDVTVKSQDRFLWDQTQVIDAEVEQTTTLSGIIFATAAGQNGNTFYITIGSDGVRPPVTDYAPPNNSTPQPMQYETNGNGSYTATVDGERIITLIDLIGWDMLQIEKEIKPLKSSEYNWNKVTGQLTLDVDHAMAAGETLYFLKKKLITV